MFLFELNEHQKKDFLDIAFHTMGINGEQKKSELEAFATYKTECQLPDHEPNTATDIDAIVQRLAKAPKIARMVTLVELFSMALADGEYCDDERKFLTSLTKQLRLEDYELKRIERWTRAFNDIISEGFQMIHKED